MKRLFVLGNGPSLLGQLPLLRRLDEEDTFACNRFCRWSQMPFAPTYYACSANAILKGVEPKAPPFKKERFLVSRMRAQLEQFEDWTKCYKKEHFPLCFQPERTPEGYVKVKGGGTMVGIMVQLAFGMRYTNIYTLGVEQKGSGHVFDPDSKDGLKYFIPDPPVLFEFWNLIKVLAMHNHVQLTDCTPDGAFNPILGYQSLEDVLAGISLSKR